MLYKITHNPTFNWPYDYCSLIELAKITGKVGFRPDLAKEMAERVTLLDPEDLTFGSDSLELGELPAGLRRNLANRITPIP